MTTLLFVPRESDRDPRVEAIRAESDHLAAVFEAESWQALLDAAHRGRGSEVRLGSVSQIPGGVWAIVRDLSRLSSLGLHLRSFGEPWLSLDDGQAKLLQLLARLHDARRRDRIREGLHSANAKVGRPRATVDVLAMAEYRATHSLRQTARQFGVGAATCHRILATRHTPEGVQEATRPRVR